MISRNSLRSLGWMFLALAPLSGVAADQPAKTAGELLEIRLEGAGVDQPLNLEISLPIQGMASKVVGPLSQSIANAVRQCPGFNQLVADADHALQIDLAFEQGRLTRAQSTNPDWKGSLPCTLRKVEATGISTFPLIVTDAKGILRIRSGRG
jgi:hypothetical protein